MYLFVCDAIFLTGIGGTDLLFTVILVSQYSILTRYERTYYYCTGIAIVVGISLILFRSIVLSIQCCQPNHMR